MGWHALIIHTRGFDYQGLHLLHDKQGLVANHCANTFKLILMTCSAWKISLDTQSDWQFSYRSQCLLPIPKLRLSSTATNWWGMVAWQPCWSTMVSKAWVLWHLASGTPQSPPTEEHFKEFATQVNGGVDMSFGMQAHLKRLHFEAAAIVMAELKSRAMDTAPDGARKLPLAEKAARFKEQEARLPGLRLKGELQPSYALVDLVAQVKETNCITWIAPSKCTKRDSEVQNSLKEKPMILSLEQQMVKLATPTEQLVADTSTDLQFQWALQRRGLAYDQCTLIKFDEHEAWVQQLLGQLTREPPPGFTRVSISQAIRADRELFTIMAQELQDSVQPDPRGVLPMEAKLKELRTDPRVTMFLLPMAKGSPKEQEKAASSTPTPKATPGPPARPTKRAKTSAKAKANVP